MSDVEIMCEHCGEVVERAWTGGGKQPLYCSDRCRRRAGAKRWRQRQQGQGRGRCPTPDKIYYLPNGAGLRRVAFRAAVSGQFVYPCRCFRFHLTSVARDVPPACIDPSLPISERVTAWFEWLTPQAAALISTRAAVERREPTPQRGSGVPK